MNDIIPSEQFPSNSYNEKKKPVVKPVAHGEIVVKKKTLREKIADFFFTNGDEPEMGEYIYQDIVKPAVLDTISDISHAIVDSIRDTVDIALFGNMRSARYRRSDSDRRYYRTSYDDDYWDRERRSRDRRRERDEDRNRPSRRSDDYIAAKVETRDEARDVVRGMQDIIRRYDCASVLNFYDLADLPTKSTDDDWGWSKTHPFEATITAVRNGYIIEPLTKPVSIRD